MSNIRQLDQGVLARSFGVTFSLRTLEPPRSHTWDQLVYATRGVLTAIADRGTWVVPPHRAVWLPANTSYSLEMSGQTALRMVYLPVGATASRAEFDRTCCSVINVSPLLRELIVRTVNIGALQGHVPQHSRIAGLIVDELLVSRAVPLQLPQPLSEVAQHFARLFDAHVCDPYDIERALSECGASRRTMERLFRAETGMSLGQWMRRRKLLAGLQALLGGESTSNVAFRLGYSTPSAFIAMFKRELGQTPGSMLEPE